MLKCFKTECVVCLERKNKVISCRICYNTNVCLDCIHSMCEKGICKLCPVCRQQNWKNIKKTKILPFTKINDIEIENIEDNSIIQNKNNYIYNCINNFKLYCSLLHKSLLTLFLSYCVGLFTIFIFNPELDLKQNYYLIWLPFIISLFWCLLIWSPCCCGKFLYNTYFNVNN